jgi:hypothetical protein
VLLVALEHGADLYARHAVAHLPRLQGAVAGGGCRGRLQGAVAGGGCRGRLQGAVAGGDCRGRLQGAVAGGGCRGRLQGAVAGGGCRGRLQGAVAGAADLADGVEEAGRRQTRVARVRLLPSRVVHPHVIEVLQKVIEWRGGEGAHMRRAMVVNSAATARCSGVEEEEEEEAGASTWSEVMRWIRGSVWRRVCSAALRKQVLPRLSRPWRPPRCGSGSRHGSSATRDWPSSFERASWMSGRVAPPCIEQCASRRERDGQSTDKDALC